jgi:hypothetical protein
LKGKGNHMTVTEQRHAVTSIERLREIINQPKPESAVMRKQLDTLDAHCRAFIAKAPFRREWPLRCLSTR